MEQRTVTIKNFFRITKIVQVSAMKVHFQIAERSLFYLNPYIHLRRIAYPSERERDIQLLVRINGIVNLYYQNLIILHTCYQSQQDKI